MTLFLIYLFSVETYSVITKINQSSAPISSPLLTLRRGISIWMPGRESNPGLPCSRPTHYHLSYAHVLCSFVLYFNLFILNLFILHYLLGAKNPTAQGAG
jgi:hypothetical protein